VATGFFQTTTKKADVRKDGEITRSALVGQFVKITEEKT